jgi:DNA ligase D-like protein (predicted ligase)
VHPRDAKLCPRSSLSRPVQIRPFLDKECEYVWAGNHRRYRSEFGLIVKGNKQSPSGSRRPASSRRSRPAFVEPMAAQIIRKLPEGDEWLYEVKFDGYRGVLIKDGLRAEIRSRKNRDLSGMYPGVVEACLAVDAEAAVIDGEIVAVDPQGRPSFQALQHRGSHSGHRVVFYAFDLLHLDGKDLTASPLEERRAGLPRLLAGSGLLLSRELPGRPSEIVAAARGLGLEGVIAKRRDSVYEPGERSGAWQKLKLELSQEFLVGGYRPGFNAVDALLVGYHEGARLRFAGKVKAGFVAHVRRDLFKKLQPLHRSTCPFADLPNSRSDRWGGGVTADEMHEMQWVKPAVVVQVRFVEWTAEGRLRHSAFVGLRTDKDASEVRRE